MASSVVALCNLALDMLGAEPITSLSDGVRGDLCNRNYPLARNAALRAYPWNCAMTRAALAAITTVPTWGYAAAYQLPVDCLRVIEVDGDVSLGLTWRVEGRTIVANTNGVLNVRYVRALDDPSFFDGLLDQAIAARLAAMISFAVTGKEGLGKTLLAVATDAERQAMRIDAREQSQDDVLTADAWTGARYNGPPSADLLGGVGVAVLG